MDASRDVEQIHAKLDKYIKEYILCSKCNNPETVEHEKYIKCKACGFKTYFNY